jgi:hypothetical protein
MFSECGFPKGAVFAASKLAAIADGEECGVRGRDEGY